MAALDARYDFKTAEPRWQQLWAEQHVYEFDPAHNGPAYTVDTPPPTISGQVTVGHVYSYTQADVLIRYHRMRGEEALYPFGFDDNGLPTERFTENVKGIRARDVGRDAFIAACLEVSAEVEAKFERFWQRSGLSVDWRLRYSTIDPRSRRVSQAAFIDLHDKGQVYRQEAPTLWCPECGTAVAQADVDDRAGVPSQISTIPFTLDDGRQLPIATTRPELLAACVAVFVHPDDERFRSYLGHSARTPLFDLQAPVLADGQVDKDKGTGAVMCCTFGDVTDVYWWRTYHLPLRIVLDRQGRLNDLAGPYAGLRVKQARQRVLADLHAAGLLLEQRPIEHTVGVHERCGTEVEYLVASQWFVRVLEHKERLLEAGRRINWYPEHMRARYENWIAGLNWDWNISRQRYYGVPFPVWYCRNCGDVVLASPDQLPVDPQSTPPPVARCPGCGADAFVPEEDVMDTWATSSVTTQICATLLEPYGVSAKEFARRYRPMSLRPNAHDIIRTWVFYSVVRSLAATGDIPWSNVLISGHALDESGKKISKSKLKAAEDPTALLETHSADALRYWATSVGTGGDTTLNTETIKKGNRLVTKLWNAARLVLPHLDGYRPAEAAPGEVNVTDRWLLAALDETVQRAGAAMAAYEFRAAKDEAERFFWTDLCDNYLELVKFRLYGEAEGSKAAGREAARYVLHQALSAVLKLLAPFLPFITEELYGAAFAGQNGEVASIHRSRWPDPQPAWRDQQALTHGRLLLEAVEAVRRYKSERHLSMASELDSVTITCPADAVAGLQGAELDLKSVTRARQVKVVAGPSEDEAISVEVLRS
jgi:valyl-tRNA synthetase